MTKAIVAIMMRNKMLYSTYLLHTGTFAASEPRYRGSRQPRYTLGNSVRCGSTIVADSAKYRTRLEIWIPRRMN